MLYYIYSYQAKGMWLENSKGLGKWNHNREIGEYQLKFFPTEQAAKNKVASMKGKAWNSVTIITKK